MIKRSRANRTERATFRKEQLSIIWGPDVDINRSSGSGKQRLWESWKITRKLRRTKAMMKHEFEERVGGEISDQNYEIIETVYTWHPAINEVGGKDQIATLYETGGMPLIKSMLEAANIMMDLDKERRQAMRRMEEIRRRIETVASGDLTEEQCRRDAVGMFDKSNTPEEWGYARMFLATKYGEELASEIIEEVEK